MVSFSLPTMPSLLSLLIPITYLGILIGSMATFSYLYRRRQTLKKLRLAPYFPPHTTRDIYLSLLHLPDTSPEKSTKIPDSVLRAALLSRACTDVERIITVRNRKPALSTLLQRGVVGDEIWQRLLRAEQELEAELKDVIAEANALAPGWGQTIFQSASEMVQNHILKEKLEGHRQGIDEEKKAWDDKKERSRKELMGEEVVEEGKQVPQEAPVVAADKVVVKGASSDEEGVLVETPENASVDSGSGGGGGGGKKKKRNKK